MALTATEKLKNNADNYTQRRFSRDSSHVNGHRSRHRRQGANLFLPASYVIPGGEGSGPWGEWGDVSPCSRTCGGGVASQKRICLAVGSDGPPCTGGDTKYFSCQTQDCPEGSGDFRSEQCAEFNDKLFRDNNRYSWIPYTKAQNPCELNCMPKGERFYYRQRLKVVDGTRCNDESFDVCVNGTCQAVGCDMMLGSNAREDKCRVCRGNGTNCRTMEGLIDDPELRRGYNDVLLIPQGATNIFIEEIRDSSNYLALRAKEQSKYYLNGDYHIDFPRSLVIAGALWHYERSQQGFAAPDKLRCIGPTNEPLYLSLLLQEDNVGVKYEYSIPSDLAPRPTQQYGWVFDQFTPCSATCGGGFQMRKVSCRSREELEEVDESLCDEALKPATNQTCNIQPCSARWVEGPWSPCSKPCGEGGIRSRQVHCEKIQTDGVTLGLRARVPDSECFDLLGAQPKLYEECNQNATCPTWFTGPWKPCDKLCGEGKQTRQVVCHAKVKGRVQVFDDHECREEKPPSEQPCNLHPCGGIDWVLSDWTGCDSCLSKTRTRIAKCATADRKVVKFELCAYHPAPILEEPCDLTKLPPCEVQWYATQWSSCSVECGKGVQTRHVFCGMFDGTSVTKVNDSKCDQQTKYKDTKPCEVPKENCPAIWYAGPWSECSKKCGGGEQKRQVMCLIDEKVVGTCDQDSMPDSLQTCNVGPCNEDEIIPVDSKSTPIMDSDYDYEGEECEEEEYDEVGAEEDEDLALNYPDEKMYSDTPAMIEGSGEYESLFTTDSGGGGGLSTKSTVTMETSSTESESTEETENTETASTVTKVTSSDTESSSTGFSKTETNITESTVTDATVKTSTSNSASTETSVTGSTDSTVTDATKEAITESSASTETSVTGTTESTVTNATTEASTESSASTKTYVTGSTESTVTNATKEASTESSASNKTSVTGTTESTVTNATKEASTESSASTETSVTSSTESTVTDATVKTSTGNSTSTETSVTGSTESTVTNATKEASTETSASNKTSVSGTTESTVTNATKEASTESSASTKTSVTGSTESPVTNATKEASTESSASTKTSVTGSTESPVTNATKEASTESSASTETSVTGSTESTVTDATVKTSIGNSASTETSVTGSTESAVTNATKEASTESSASTKTSVTGSTESTVTNATKEASTESSVSTKTSVTGSTESPVTNATKEASTESLASTETSVTGSTESTVTNATKEASTESSASTKTSVTGSTESTVTNATKEASTESSASTKTSVTGSTESTVTDATVKTSTGISASTETSVTGSTESTVTDATKKASTESSASTETSVTGTTESTVTDATKEASTESSAITETSVTGSTESPVTDATVKTSTGNSTSTETSVTGSTESTVADATKEASTESSVSTETSVTGTTESTVTDATKKASTESSASTKTSVTGSTESPVTNATKEASTESSASTETSVTGSTESTVTNATKEASTESSASTETFVTGSTESTVTNATKEASTESSASTKTSVTGSTESTVTNATKEASTESSASTKTSVSGSTESPVTNATKEASTESSASTKTSVTGSTESTVTNATKEASTESSASTKTSVTGSTESTVTNATKEASTESSASTKTSVTGSTESPVTNATKEASTESSASTKTSVTGSTESPVTNATKEASTESSASTETSVTGSTESTVTDATVKTSIGNSASTETSVTGSTESAVTNATKEASTESSASTKTSVTGSTESTVTNATKEASTESSASTKTSVTGSTESPVTNATKEASTESLASTETSVTGSTESTVTNATKEASTESSASTKTSVTGSTESTVTNATKEASTESSASTKTSVAGTTESTVTNATKEASTESSASTKTSVTGSTESTVTESPKTSVTGSSETTETGSTISTKIDTTETGRTETDVTGSTVKHIIITTSSETAVTSSTDSTVSDLTKTASTEPTDTTITESVNTDTTESSVTTESLTDSSTSESSTDTTESESSTSADTTESTETSVTESAGSTEMSSTEETETTLTGLSTTEMSTEESTTFSSISTSESWASTIQGIRKKPKCRRRKIAKCLRSKFGCCPDKKTPAAGPFDKGCPTPKTCKDTKFGCCDDRVSPATGPEKKGCPVVNCKETLYGCCLSDNVTPAEGNDQEGCPKPRPACEKSKYGCCKDGETKAKGPKKKGCPETETKKPETKPKGCEASKFGCCADNKTEATGPDGAGCSCNTTKFGCCPDGVSPASSADMEGCVTSCNASEHGCCQDGRTPAHGPDFEGCCLQSPFGCCPDNYKPADGPHMEGCECQHARYGCCPDNITIARGPYNEGCGCKHSQFGCCPDRHTEAKGPNFEGCDCSTYQFGCCADGVTAAKGPGQQGCHCQQTKFGCCGDGKTAAEGPDQLGCNCASSRFGCCPDGVTEAKGEKFLNCTDVPENRQAACSLAADRGPCRNFTVYWFYDMTYGGCSRFWYGGCEGNGNRFSSKEECDDVCVEPNPKDTCKLPKVKGPCNNRHLRWHYDSNREQCMQFEFGGCLGNANNFESRELCQKQCEPDNTEDQCTLPIERGPCAGNFGRWGYDPDSGRCEQFIWGGCEGNSNRFSSEAACLQRCNPPGVQKPECTQPQESGNCTDKLALWSFSLVENRCLPFYYSGCGGNDNRFDSEASCAENCPSAYVQETCALPALTGGCENYTLRWFFDTSENRCRQFYYGGCGGNENNFVTEEQCTRSCSEQQLTTTTPSPVNVGPALPDVCFLESDPGPCNNYETRWSYDSIRGRCYPFEYGGCGGNQNNFRDETKCQYYCTPAQDACQLPALPGPCGDWSLKWFYNTSIDTCQQFYYGGCEGNDNRFESQQACERRCKKTDEPATPATTTTRRTRVYTAPTTPTTPVPTTSGSPSNKIPPGCQTVSGTREECVEAGEVWYLDLNQGVCVSHENAASGTNCVRQGAYSSQEACERACGAFNGLDACQLPALPGPCGDWSLKWFYNTSIDTCQQFYYGGCEGNDNRFESQQACERRCKKTDEPAAPATTTTRRTRVYTAPTTPTTPVPTTSGSPSNKIPPGCQTVSGTREECVEAGEVWYLDLNQGVCVSHENAASGTNCVRQGAYSSQEACERACGAFNGLDVCRYEVDAGPCNEVQAKVYFDATRGVCEPFVYGGCHGGPNRFSSVQECEDVCKPQTDPCKQPSESGNCLGYIIKWYYDELRNDCGQFVYTGCGGNDNRFETREDCLGRCVRRDTTTIRVATVVPPATTTTTTPVPISPPVQGDEECRTPTSLEPCGENMTIYYYDTRTGACLSGDFGGCRYANSYSSEEECERRCGAFRNVDVCRAQLDPGPCSQSVPKVYWDARSGRCLSFAYGGCLGGPNRFSSVQECEDVCGDTGPEAACLQEVDSGAAGCGQPARRWRYDAAAADCRAFVFLGCGGNTNNFPSFEECAARCLVDGDNAVLPECERFNEECRTLRCDYGVERAQTEYGCERCICSPAPVDRCERYRAQCESLQCPVERTVDADGCERCQCLGDPCVGLVCPAGERCKATLYQNPVTGDPEYLTECRAMNKSGSCPYDDDEAREECERMCNDDADCEGVGKCCLRGCNALCLLPAAPTTTRAPLTTTTYLPEVPLAPQANVETQPEVSVAEGGKATLRCLFHGNPPPNITWRRGEITIESDMDRYRLLSDGALEIVSIYRNDSGVYICIGNNALGSATQEVRLEVNDPEEGSAGIAGAANAVVSGALGRPVNIRCLAFGYPPPSIYWYRGRNGPMVPYSSALYEARGNVLQIRSLTLETAGEYICQAYNGIGKPAEWAVTVQIQRPHSATDYPWTVTGTPTTERDTTTTHAPAFEYSLFTVPVTTSITLERTTVAAGAELSIPCAVDGYPLPQVYWTKDSVRLVPSDRMMLTDARLTISGANINDSGEYGCHASNAFSSHTSTVQITVEGLYIPPKCTDNPFFANCALIVRSKYCKHPYYSKFCCKSCVKAGQLNLLELDLALEQADEAWKKRK